MDTQVAQLVDVLKAAYAHPGAAFVEIFQNCIVYNEDVFSEFTARDKVEENQVYLQDGSPLIYGTDGARALTFDQQSLGLTGTDELGAAMTHDAGNRNLAFALAQMAPPELPMAVGVLYDHAEPAYETRAAETAQNKTLEDVMRSGFTWNVGP